MMDIINPCFSLLFSLWIVQGLQSVQGEQNNHTKNVLLSMGTLKSIFQPLLSSGDSTNLDSYVDNIINRFNMRTKTTTESNPIKINSEVDKPLTQFTLNENSLGTLESTTVRPINKPPTQQETLKVEVKSSNTNDKLNPNKTLSTEENNNSLLNFIKQEILKKISLKPQSQFLSQNNQNETWDEEKVESPETPPKQTENQLKPLKSTFQDNQKLNIKPYQGRPSKYSVRTTPIIKKQKLKYKKQDNLNDYKKFDNNLQESNDKLDAFDYYTRFTQVKRKPSGEININSSYDEKNDNEEDTINHDSKKDVLVKDVSNHKLNQNINGILKDLVENHKSESNDNVRVILKELQEVVSKNEIKNINELNRLFNGIVEKHTTTTELPVKVQSEQQPQATQIKFGQNVFWNLWNNLAQQFAPNPATDVQSPTTQLTLPFYLTQFPSKILPMAHIAGVTALGAFALGALVASPFPRILRRSDDGKIAWLESLSFWKNKDKNEEAPPIPFPSQNTRNVFTSNLQYPTSYPSAHDPHVDYNASPYYRNPINYSWTIRRNDQRNRNNYHHNQHSGYHLRKSSLTRSSGARGHQARFDREKKNPQNQRLRSDAPPSRKPETSVRTKVSNSKKNSKSPESETKTRYVTVDEVNKITQKSLLDLLKNYREILSSEETEESEHDSILSGSSNIPTIVHPRDRWVPLSESQKNIPRVQSKTPSQTESSEAIKVRIGYPPGYKQRRLQQPIGSTSSVKITQNKGANNSPGLYKTTEKDEGDALRGHLINFRDKYMSRYGILDNKAQT